MKVPTLAMTLVTVACVAGDGRFFDRFGDQDSLDPTQRPEAQIESTSSEYSCPDGKVVVDKECVDCASGSYYESKTRTCEPCKLGYYQNETGQVACKLCPQIAGRPGVTKNASARSVGECRERCAAGRYFDDKDGSCRSCDYGYYQNEEGKFSCWRCDRGFTTRTEGAVSANECHKECESGLQLGKTGLCKPCQRGTYRTKGIHHACKPCPDGTTSLGPGASKAVDCSLPICTAGTFFSNISGQPQCLKCPKGTYQPEELQISCIDCPQDTSTRDVGATSPDDCNNYCEVHGEQMLCDPYAVCLPIPATNDSVCQCKPGFNGTGENCTDKCENFCQNDGVCKKNEEGELYCVCSVFFTGNVCHIKSNYTYIVGAFAGGIVVSIVVLVCICIYARRRRRLHGAGCTDGRDAIHDKELCPGKCPQECRAQECNS